MSFLSIMTTIISFPFWLVALIFIFIGFFGTIMKDGVEVTDPVLAMKIRALVVGIGLVSTTIAGILTWI